MTLLGLALLAASAAAGWVLLRVRRPPPRLPERATAQAPIHEDEHLYPEGLALRRGDVLLRAGGGEAWLDGAVALLEDRPAATLFFAPERGEPIVVYARPGHGPWWLEETTAPAVPAGEPPPTLDLDGHTFTRRRRLPVAFRIVGGVTPPFGDSGLTAEYDDGGDGRVLLVTRGTRAWAYRGAELRPGFFEVLPGGRAASAS